MSKKYRWKANRPLSEIALSPELEEVMMDLAEPVLRAAQEDPNPEYVEGLRLTAYRTRGRRGRVTANIKAAPGIGSAVEAKRGTMGRAIGNAGA